MLRRKLVALAIVANEYAFGRDKIKGVIDYYRKHSGWEIQQNDILQPFMKSEDLAGWKGDGVIGEIYTREDAAVLGSLPMPFVNTSSCDLAGDCPSVSVDNRAIGHMAADHLMSCKLDNFAFVGAVGLRHARERYEGFVQAIEQSDNHCSLIKYEPRKGAGRHVSEELVSPEKLMGAMRGLTLPVGIMAATDRTGFVVLEACRRLGLRSPEDVALIGVDNDEICCNLVYSSMTSIDPQARQVGFQAAVMLDKLMDGETLEEKHVLIPPGRVVFRNSTDTTRSEYFEVALALRFIRNSAGEFIDVSNVLDMVPVSRRWLEMKFKEEVGHGVYQEIRRVHVERARELLVTTDWPISRVAKESGFNNTERFDFAFQKLVRMSAAVYRKKQFKSKR